MDMDGNAMGLKLGCKLVKLWKKNLHSKRLGSHYTPNDQPQPGNLSKGHSFSRATSLHSITRSKRIQCLGKCRIKASGNCLNLLTRTKRHIGRHLSWRKSSFVKGAQEKKTQYLPKDVPKGSVAVYVGDEQEEQTRFVIPILYFNHPLFLHLLEEAESVYGFCNKGILTIPCQVSDFEYLRWLIEREGAMNRLAYSASTYQQ